MRVADYIIKTLTDKYNVKHIFLVTGGGAMHLNDAVGKNKKIKYICNHHEQASAMAAEGYSRISGKVGVTMVTSGPGGGNAVTGVMGAWLDSIPMLVLSGQVKIETTILKAPGLRQLGDQEINITDIVRPITKYSVMVTSSEDIRYHLERAMYLAEHGRPGPVWLDIPLDIQAAEIDPNNLREYNSDEDSLKSDLSSIKTVVKKLFQAKRPVIVAGNGIRLSGASDLFSSLVNKLKIPVLTSILGIDLIETDHPYFYGRPGILGDRAANFILQNSDCVLILGARMGIRILGYNYKSFAREAYKIMVDIDSAELSKPTLNIDLPICSDASEFLQALNLKLQDQAISLREDWLNYCSKIKKKYPWVLDEHRKIEEAVSSYVFPEELSKNLLGDEIIVTANGTIYTSTFQSICLKKGNRMFSNQACASMGYGLPAAIGASFASNKKKSIICLTGDGSIQMNLQELQTVLNYHLPIKIFMYNNNGYVSIKNTQKAFFDGNLVGSSPESGVILPNMLKLAEAYGFPIYKITNHNELRKNLPAILAQKGPLFCEIKTPPFEMLGPKASTMRLSNGQLVSRPLEDLAPLLPREEFLRNMIIPPFDKSK